MSTVSQVENQINPPSSSTKRSALDAGLSSGMFDCFRLVNLISCSEEGLRSGVDAANCDDEHRGLSSGDEDASTFTANRPHQGSIIIQHSSSVFKNQLTLKSSYVNSIDQDPTKLYLFSITHISTDIKNGCEVKDEFIQPIQPFHVVIRGDGPRRDFCRQTTCSMLAAMLGQGSDLYPFKLELFHNVHVIVPSHDTIDVDIIAYEKMGFTKILTYISNHHFEAGTVRLAAQVGEVITRFWANQVSSVSSSSDLFHPFKIIFNKQNQERLSVYRKERHMLHVQLVITRLLADDIKCYYEKPTIRLEDPLDLEKSMAIIQSEFPKINPSILSK